MGFFFVSRICTDVGGFLLHFVFQRFTLYHGLHSQPHQAYSSYFHTVFLSSSLILYILYALISFACSGKFPTQRASFVSLFVEKIAVICIHQIPIPNMSTKNKAIKKVFSFSFINKVLDSSISYIQYILKKNGLKSKKKKNDIIFINTQTRNFKNLLTIFHAYI